MTILDVLFSLSSHTAQKKATTMIKIHNVIAHFFAIPPCCEERSPEHADRVGHNECLQCTAQ